MPTPKKYFIIDFDSTFIKLEGLEELARIVLSKNSMKVQILTEIKNITNLGMTGKLSFTESLRQRMELLSPKNADIKKLVSVLKKEITPSFQRNKEFFTKFAGQIYIISGGFSEWIEPVCKDFGISPEHILANRFSYDKDNEISGYQTSELLAQDKGKVKALESLKLNGDILVIGDGFTDYELKLAGKAKKFYVFTENLKREEIVAKADRIIPNLDEFLYIEALPRAHSYPKNRIHALLLENIDASAVNILAHEGYTIECLPGALSEEELCAAIPNVSLLGIRSKTLVTKKVLEQAPKLLAIGTFCIGTNQVDLNAAAEQGVAVFNAPYSNTRSVAELVIGEIIALNRQLADRSTKLHQGIWDKSSNSAHEVRGKTLGIIGYGNIGSQLSVLAESLGMRVLFFDKSDKLALGNAVAVLEMKTLLKEADVVSIHVDGRPENKNLIGAKELAQMKPGSILLNLSRGHIVDLDALSQAIRSGRISGAAVDVYPVEPKNNSEKLITPLQGLPNVILTPHVGGSTVEAQAHIGKYVSNKLIEYVNNGDTILSVNFPQITLPKDPATHRLIHIHRNEPGVLAALNSIMGNNGINVEGQALKTSDNIGYAITDVNREYDTAIIEKLKAIPATIKLRVIY